MNITSIYILFLQILILIQRKCEEFSMTEYKFPAVRLVRLRKKAFPNKVYLLCIRIYILNFYTMVTIDCFSCVSQGKIRKWANTKSAKN